MVAFTLIKLLNTPAELAIRLMLIATAPSWVTSNVLTKFTNGGVALSISLTVIVSLVSIISIYITPTAAYALTMMISSIFFIFIIKKNT